MNTPREIPKLFSASMIKALLSGTKTMTRRLDGLEEINQAPDEWRYDGRSISSGNHVFTHKSGDVVYVKPSCHPGDILAARETWTAPAEFDAMKPRDIPAGTPVHYLADGPKPEGYGKTRPGIFLPRQYWRIKRPITAEERCERVQDISEDDAVAEGVLSKTGMEAWQRNRLSFIAKTTPADAFRELWGSIHGESAWDYWVRVITFRGCKP